MPGRVGVFWDVDGTLADSSGLGWRATNAVLAATSLQPVTMEEYHEGTRFTTPERFSWHISQSTGDPLGLTLGSQFDAMYVGMVTEATTALYPGVRELLDTVVRRAGVEVVFAALSNACGAYVRRVLEVQGLAERFQLQLGADQVGILRLRLLLLLLLLSFSSSGRWRGPSPTQTAWSTWPGSWTSLHTTASI